ncbi:putative RNA-binding protein [Rubidibacter lacunae KORDI 51-2]|uniref:Putative RNA-binding protein n=2 Tax=Rubidibacter TaxID=582491 RepID=U5DL27_9CHRO|nr:R3H domain-containing nucleic acid-binding protein [Rubidibacter lacunae]ERN42391.1 putative RNA-binding protein [Rubidibacter lacunae KORDI 51-2]
MTTPKQAQRGQEWLESVIALMGIPAGVSTTFPDAEDETASCWLTVDSAALSEGQLAVLLGSQEGCGRSEPLDALQYLANTLLNLGVPDEEQQAFTTELNGYRLRRQQELQTLADAVAQQVRDTGEEAEMKELSSAERRQVHSFLKRYDDLETYSRGQEPDRRLAVKLRSPDRA